MLRRQLIYVKQGCNIPDIDIVVQWKLPGSVSAFVQRAGRAARLSTRTGLAVMLVEQSVYTTMLDEKGAKPEAKTKEAKQKAKAGETAAKRNHGIARGSKRGGTDRQNDAIIVKDCPPIDQSSSDEGVYSLVQSGTCRRAILTEIYNNPVSGKWLLLELE